MATKPPRKAGAITTIAPAIPLAIALLSSAVLPSGQGTARVTNGDVEAVKCEDSIEDFRACHTAYPTGCSSTGNYDPYLNLMKNQTKWDSLQPEQVFSTLREVLQLEAKLPADLGKANHGDNWTQLKGLGEGKIHGIVGYLYDIKVEGKESSNCQLEDDATDENVDFHIFVGFDPGIAEKLRNHTALTAAEKKQVTQESMIVEMTPHYRAEFHPEWTAEAVKAQKGAQVKVLGQLMVDNEHYVSGQDCAKSPRTASCWRASVWELHPVTDFEVCDTGNCTAASSSGWVPITEGDSVAKSSSASESEAKHAPRSGRH